MKRVSNRSARASIERREEFQSHTGNFRGEAHEPGRYVYTGHLSGRLRTTDTVGQADYIVFSYSTPIGWHIPGEGWIIPPASYSVTTSNHQGIVRWAASGNMSPRNLPDSWALGCTGKAADILQAVRYGNSWTREKGERIMPLARVVSTGEAAWDPNDPNTIHPTKEA